MRPKIAASARLPHDAPAAVRTARYHDPVTQPPDTVVVEETAQESELEKRFQLILLDDNDHTYQYVIGMLGRIFGYGREKAFAIASIVDNQGQAVVETAAYDRVIKHQRLIHSYGPDPSIERCRGSMSALVEEAP